MSNYVKTKTVYGKDVRGKLRYWKILQSDHNTIQIEYGIDGGEPNYESEVVDYGLAGRTKQEQIELRIKSRLNKKLDSGYVYDKELAMDTQKLNTLGFEKPMLAKRWEKIKNTNFKRVYVQMKYDGHRCLIKNDNGNLIAYSRNGKKIDSIDHILDSLKYRLKEGYTIDGELYHHGTPLQTITSWVRKKQDNSKLLRFICYDVIMDECYSKRFTFINNINSFSNFSNFQVASTVTYLNDFDPKHNLDMAKELNYEGVIVRPIGIGYEAGKRSNGLIKIKSWFDDEYKVTGITAGVDGQAILHMLHDGKAFKATAPGTLYQKRETFMNLEKYVGKKVNIQYANLTKDGIPFHPVATMWRNVEDE